MCYWEMLFVNIAAIEVALLVYELRWHTKKLDLP
ncbi:MAG: hypothetical protein ACI83D_000365 [Planctomycetota bacterium]|jgi:hypothetical protein